MPAALNLSRHVTRLIRWPKESNQRLQLKTFCCQPKSFVTKESTKESILKNTVISTNHLTPEIRLHLITKECELYHKPITTDGDRVFKDDPFWGFYWPGGQAISRFILDNSEVVRDKNVLDVGSGSGACSIAAMISGASMSTANDIDTTASESAVLNAELNSVKLRTSWNNLIGEKNLAFDCILLGDVFYDVEIADQLIPWLHSMKTEGKRIFIGDPGRHALDREKVTNLRLKASYELPKNVCIENHGFKNVFVWEFL